MAEFARGKCAMIQNGDWAWNTIANTDGKVVEDENVVFIPITTGVEGEENMGLNVGASQYMCINSQLPEEDQQAAIAFLEWLFSSDKGKEIVAQSLQFVTPFSTMADAVYTNPLRKRERHCLQGQDRLLLGCKPSSRSGLERHHGRGSSDVCAGPDGMG